MSCSLFWLINRSIYFSTEQVSLPKQFSLPTSNVVFDGSVLKWLLFWNEIVPLQLISAWLATGHLVDYTNASKILLVMLQKSDF